MASELASAGGYAQLGRDSMQSSAFYDAAEGELASLRPQRGPPLQLILEALPAACMPHSAIDAAHMGSRPGSFSVLNSRLRSPLEMPCPSSAAVYIFLHPLV